GARPPRRVPPLGRRRPGCGLPARADRCRRLLGARGPPRRGRRPPHRPPRGSGLRPGLARRRARLPRHLRDPAARPGNRCVGGAAAALAVLGALVGEPRLAALSGAFVGLGLVHALVLEAPLTDLFTVQAHPAAGVPALLCVIAAGAVLVALAPPGYDRERELG